MAIFLVQHGRSLPKEQDPLKGLSTEGAIDVRRIVQVAATYGVRVTEILHSGKQRALQTAEIVAAELNPQKGMKAVKGIGPMDDVVAFAETLDLASNVMLVGHLPFLEKLAAFLITGHEGKPVFEMQNGGILCLDYYRETKQVAVKWALMPKVS